MFENKRLWLFSLKQLQHLPEGGWELIHNIEILKSYLVACELKISPIKDQSRAQTNFLQNGEAEMF